MSRVYFLGVDTSTTSSKALLMDDRGEVIAIASSPHTLQTPKPLWSEQDPREWWVAVSTSIRAVLGKAGIQGEQVAAVGLTGQMHGLVQNPAQAERRFRCMSNSDSDHVKHRIRRMSNTPRQSIKIG